MPTVTYLEAIRQGIWEEMERDPSVFCIGEDIGIYGGAFKVTDGFIDRFGAARVIDTPIAESAIVGAAYGASLTGMRPVAEFQFMDFIGCAFNQIVNMVAKAHYRWGAPAPMVLRGPSGGNVHGGPFHSQNTEPWFYRTPGLKIVVPSTPHDARGLMASAVADPDPVLYYEHIALYRDPRIKQVLTAEAPAPVPIGRAALRRVHLKPYRLQAKEGLSLINGTQISTSIFADALEMIATADFDIIDFLHLLTDRSISLLAASAAGVVLADPRGELRVAAASSEEAGLLELFQLQNDQGPCLECFRTGRAVTATDMAGPDGRWPRFAEAAARAGFATVEALPMRLRDQVIGALNLFRAEPGPLDPADLRIGQALADVATIGLLHERNVRHRETVAEQLQAALNSRVVIEQAKGKLAERLSVDMDRAFTMLRDYARNTNQRLTDVARDFVDGATADFPPPARRQRGR